MLIHCSDGWDRTAELSTLVQLMLDPFYRTFKGFQILIEKDWVSYGHMFERRMGHFKADKQDLDQRSPIFVQWLDCVYQIVKQFPTAFQFNVNLLHFLAHEVYTCKFGTFLFDCESERVEMNVRKKTVSIWTYVNKNIMEFINPFYQKDVNHGGYFGITDAFNYNIIIPMTDDISITLFQEHFLKWNYDHQQQLSES